MWHYRKVWEVVKFGSGNRYTQRGILDADRNRKRHKGLRGWRYGWIKQGIQEMNRNKELLPKKINKNKNPTKTRSWKTQI